MFLPSELGKGRHGAANTWRQVLGKEAEVRMGGAERKGGRREAAVCFCDCGRGMLMWVLATVGARDVGCTLCPHLSSGEKGPGGLAAEWVASRGLA